MYICSLDIPPMIQEARNNHLFREKEGRGTREGGGFGADCFCFCFLSCRFRSERRIDKQRASPNLLLLFRFRLVGSHPLFSPPNNPGFVRLDPDAKAQGPRVRSYAGPRDSPCPGHAEAGQGRHTVCRSSSLSRQRFWLGCLACLCACVCGPAPFFVGREGWLAVWH